MAKPVLISGIQPTGRLHIGNYLGALKQFIELQNSGKYQCYFFIADYHSLTNYSDEIGQYSLNLVVDYLASGLDAKKSTIFMQSSVPFSTELAWIFNTLTPLGDLYRMTQFKDKSSQKNSQNAGLLTYPTLMAADILLYDPKFVPVGEDQLQHLELTREIARKFNKKFGKTFIEPEAILSKTPRLMSLDDPTKKMSKSLPQGCLFLDDAPEVVKNKVMRAVTDSGSEVRFDESKKPAISNLMLIYGELSGLTNAKVEKKFAGKQYSHFKDDLADLVVSYFEPFNKKKRQLSKKISQVRKQLADGNAVGYKMASAKMAGVKDAIKLLSSK
ncbi:MAG: tryptophan--tRNA ligase [bacterium]|nr:tryptophan--tRNA ligase [bacterium]